MIVPNACVTLGVPVDIFDFDILPGAGGLKKLENPGSCPISDYK
jgi:formamidase